MPRALRSEPSAEQITLLNCRQRFPIKRKQLFF
jgi:hypothetical protein